MSIIPKRDSERESRSRDGAPVPLAEQCRNFAEALERGRLLMARMLGEASVRRAGAPPRLSGRMVGTKLTTAGYNPDEPRVPAGSGRESGRWTGAPTGGHRPFRISLWQVERPSDEGNRDARFIPASDEFDEFDVKMLPATLTGDAHIDKTTLLLNGIAHNIMLMLGHGSGHDFGSRAHKLFELAVKNLHRPDLHAEHSMDWEGAVKYGTDGSVRTDVILGKDLRAPHMIWDLKTGTARMSKKQASRIYRAHPGFKGNIIIIKVWYELRREA